MFEGKLLVLLFDEFGNLRGEPLLFVLGELRSGYTIREDGNFPSSVILCGMRNLRDYKDELTGTFLSARRLHSTLLQARYTPYHGPAEQVVELYVQHTLATGQQFEPAAIERAFHWTRGQPWLVNRMAFEVARIMVFNGSVAPNETISAEHIDRAAQVLIDERSAHVEFLHTVVSEPRVTAVVSAMVAGSGIPAYADLEYCRELGLIVGGNKFGVGATWSCPLQGSYSAGVAFNGVYEGRRTI